MLQKRYKQYHSLLFSIITIIVFLIIWELCAGLQLIDKNFLPRPSTVGSTIFKGLVSSVLIEDTLSSLQRVLVGFCIGSGLALVLGFLCAFFSKVKYSIKPLIELIRPIPPIAWIPLSILWFGIGNPSAYFLVSLGAFFPVFSNTFLGLSQVSTGTIEVARCHGASNYIIFSKVIMPQALPTVFSGFKTGVGVCWMIVITAELTGVQSGLGYYIQVSRSQLETGQVIAGMVVIGCVGLLLNYILKILGRRLMPWQGRQYKISHDE